MVSFPDPTEFRECSICSHSQQDSDVSRAKKKREREGRQVGPKKIPPTHILMGWQICLSHSEERKGCFFLARDEEGGGPKKKIKTLLH